MTCALGSTCVSVGYSIDYETDNTTPAILRSTDGGLKWRSRTAPTDTLILNAVACASRTTCVALGTSTQSSNHFVVDASSDGGSKWTSGTVPPPIEDISGLSCWSPSDCLAVGSTENATQPVDTEGVAITTSNYGTSWTVGASPDGLSKIDNVTCVSATECIAVGTSGQSSPGIDTSSNGGTSWTPATISGDTADMSSLSGVACSGSNTCMAYGFDMILLSARRGTWTPATLPDNIEITDVACPSNSLCLGVGQNAGSLIPAVYSTTHGGAQWSAQSVPGAAGTALFGIDCPTSDDCVAVGYTQDGDGPAYVVRTSDAGVTWTSQDVPAGVSALADVGCASAVDCTAAGRGRVVHRSLPHLMEGWTGRRRPFLPSWTLCFRWFAQLLPAAWLGECSIVTGMAERSWGEPLPSVPRGPRKPPGAGYSRRPRLSRGSCASFASPVSSLAVWGGRAFPNRGAG